MRMMASMTVLLMGISLSVFAGDVLVNVKKGNTPMPGQRVSAVDVGGKKLGKPVVTDEQGIAHFSITDGIQFQCRFTYLGTEHVSELFTAPGEVTFAIPEDTVVTLTENLQPLVNVGVRLYDDAGTFLQQQDRTDANGQAIFSLTAGTVATARFRMGRNLITAGQVTAGGNLNYETIPAPPVVYDIAELSFEDVVVSITLSASDPNNDQLTFTIGNASHGTAVLVGDVVTYTPDANYNGTDMFTYTAKDQNGLVSNLGSITIYLQPVNDVPEPVLTALTVVEDTVADANISAFDPDGDVLAYTIKALPQHGVLVGVAPNLTYTPNPDWSGQHIQRFNGPGLPANSFIVSGNWTVQGGQLLGDLGRLDFQVPASRSPGVSCELEFENSSGFQAGLSLYTQSLDRYYGEVEGTMWAHAGYDPATGTRNFAIELECSLNLYHISPLGVKELLVQGETFLLDPADFAALNENVQLLDQSETATFAWLYSGINWVDETIFYNYRAPGRFRLDMKMENGKIVASVLNPANPDDRNEPANTLTSLSYTLPIEQNPELSKVSLEVRGGQMRFDNLTYTESGTTDQFIYTVSDGIAPPVEQVVAVTLSSVDDAPVAEDEAFSVAENSSVDIHLFATDADTPASDLVYTVVSAPALGTLTGTAPHFTYTPNPDLVGEEQVTDTFTFKAGYAPDVESNIATVSIQIVPITDNTPPYIFPNFTLIETEFDTPVTLSLYATDIDGDAFTFFLTAGGKENNGVATINGTTLTYTPNAGFVGTDTILYQATDGMGQSNIAEISINVNERPNQPPTVSNFSATTFQDTPVSLLLQGTDPDNDPLTYFITFDDPAAGNWAEVSLPFTYSPATGFTGTATLYYKANDGSVDSGIGVISVAVKGLTVFWNGGGSTEKWSDGANWSAGMVPVPACTVIFDGTTSKNCVVDVNSTVKGLHVKSSYTGSVTVQDPAVILEVTLPAQ